MFPVVAKARERAWSTPSSSSTTNVVGRLTSLSLVLAGVGGGGFQVQSARASTGGSVAARWPVIQAVFKAGGHLELSAIGDRNDRAICTSIVASCSGWWLIAGHLAGASGTNHAERSASIDQTVIDSRHAPGVWIERHASDCHVGGRLVQLDGPWAESPIPPTHACSRGLRAG
jgi:hypothetical protein